MAKSTLELEIFPTAGGLQSANNPALIAPDNLQDCNNIIFTNDASRKTRPGFKNFYASGITSTKNFQLLYDFWRLNTDSGSQSNKVVAVIDGKVFADSGGTGVFRDVTGSFTLSGTDIVTADVLGGILIMGFQNSFPKKYNHSGDIENVGGSPPRGSIYRTYRGFPWLAGIPTAPHTVYRGEFENPDVWSGASTETISVSEGDGDPEGVTSLFPEFYGDMYVAKRRSLYRIRLNTSGIFTVELVLRGVGCISHNSAVALQNDIIFCSERGVHSLATTEKYGDAATSFLSAPIQDIYNKELDFSRAKQIQAAYVPELNSYVMTFPTKGTTFNKDMLGFNIVTGQWYRWKNVNANAITTFVDFKMKTKLMIGTSDARIGISDDTARIDFDSDAIDSSFKTGIIYPLKSPKRTVAYKQLTVVYKPQGSSDFNVTYSIDGSDIETLNFSQVGGDSVKLGPGFTLGSTPLSSAGKVKVATKPLRGSGRGIQLAFERNPSGTTIKQGMEILGYIIEFKDAEHSGKDSVQ